MKEVGRVLYGSQNLGLDGPDSDKDYKVLMAPSFEDLYFARKAEKNDLPSGLDHEHYSVVDVRTFDRLVRNGNPNTLEMLFSLEKQLDPRLQSYFESAQELYASGFLVLVAYPFFKATKGLVFNSLDRYGVNRKSASRALFWFYFLKTLPWNDFKVNKDSWFFYNARDMRFGSTLELPSLSKLQEMFDDVEKEFYKEQNHFLNHLTAFETNYMEHSCNYLNDQMQLLVINNM